MTNEIQEAAFNPPVIETIENFVIDREHYATQEDALKGQQRAGGKELWLPYNEIKIREGQNYRKAHNYFRTEEELKSFALSLKAGQSEPGTVDALMIDGEVVYTLDHGNRRHMAYKWLHENGHGIMRMWVRINSSKTTPEDRLFRMINSNGGKPFEDDELAEVLKELYNNGWTDIEKLSAKVCIPKSKVYQLLSFSNEHITVKDAVSRGDISMSTVMAAKKNIKNRESRTAAINTAISNKKTGGSKKRVTIGEIAPDAIDKKREARIKNYMNEVASIVPLSPEEYLKMEDFIRRIGK